MRSSRRRLSVYVNESALKAWLAGGKPGDRTGAPPPTPSNASEPRPAGLKNDKGS